MRLILVRHGQTSSNVDHLLDTAAPGADLTELGRQQAGGLVEALGDEPVDLLVASTLVRTQQTAAPLAAHLGLTPWIRDGVREIAAGDLEMRGDAEAQRGYLTAIFGWGTDGLHVRVPGGESGEEFYVRFDGVIEEVVSTGARTAVLVSHGAAIRAWVAARAENISREFTARTPVNNAGVIVLEGEPGSWRVLTWEGEAVAGPDTSEASGPAGEPVRVWPS